MKRPLTILAIIALLGGQSFAADAATKPALETKAPAAAPKAAPQPAPTMANVRYAGHEQIGRAHV